VKLISYNVNGIRAAHRKDLVSWLQSAQPDILCLQEIKATEDQIPLDDFTSQGYYCYWFPARKKGYSGTAILTKTQPCRVQKGTGVGYIDCEGRVMRMDFEDYTVINSYFPSGSTPERQAIKMRFLSDFEHYIRQLQEERSNIIITGDFNICHRHIDIHDPVRNAHSPGFLPEERAWLTDFFNLGFTDAFRVFNPEPHHYTWWSYRTNARVNNKGWRIDYCALSASLVPRLKRCVHLTGAHHSDHCPVMIEW
jgi:exodeoxyribonuclease III